METVQHGDPEKINQAKEEQAAAALRKARITAIVFGVITTLALISLVYGFVQHGQVATQTKRADSLQVVSDSLHAQVQKYIDAAAKQKKIAEENAKLAKQKAEAAKKHTAAKPTATKSKKTKPKK